MWGGKKFIFLCEQIYQLGFSGELISKFAVRELIFHCMINSSVNLKQSVNQIW